MLLLEGVRGVFQENEAEHDVLVLGGVQVVAELVGGSQSFASNPSVDPLPFSGFVFVRAMSIRNVCVQKHMDTTLYPLRPAFR